MNFRFTSFLIVFALLSSAAKAEVAAPTTDERLGVFDVATELPQTSMRVLRGAFSKEALVPWLYILGSTGVLYHYDEDILREAQYWGRDMGIGNVDKTRTKIKWGKYDILRLPTDTGSALYFLGDGWTHMTIAASFLGTGYFGDHTRPFNTGLEMLHGFTVSTLFNQALKRSFGRQAPVKSTEPRGAWHPFVSFNEYGRHTSTYDAMPSGHIMTATLTFTVIHFNYPEYDTWTYGIGATWLTLLAYQMVNNGVHWASDYPIGIAMGYYIGKMSTRMHKPLTDESKTVSTRHGFQFSDVEFYPSITPDGSMYNLVYQF